MNAYDNAFAFTNYLAGEGLSIRFTNRDRRDDLGCVRLKTNVGGAAFRVQFNKDGGMEARIQTGKPLDADLVTALAAVFPGAEVTEQTVAIFGTAPLAFARAFHRLYCLVVAFNV